MTLFQGYNMWEDDCLFDVYDMSDNLFGKGLELIPDDPFESFLSSENQLFRGIHLDYKHLDSGDCTSASDESVTSEIFENSNKYEIRNHDCMWSGNCELNKDGSYTCGYRHISKNNNKQQVLKAPQQNAKSAQIVQNIPPGGSLLINSRANAKKQEKFKIPNLLTSDFLKERENLIIPRPDTPVSLDDDPPEFKHSVDLSACVMGSNNISLDADKAIINKLKEQLEDTSTHNLDIKTIIPGNKKRTLSEVLNVIGTVENDSSLCADDSDSDSESTISSVMYKDSSPSQQSNYQSVMHSDHSYTRSKGGVDIIGLETPSDSDEEIDVVSVGDKKLPTNPSDKDRRVIQNKVAHRISTRIVTTPGGIRTIPPRRRGSIDPPYYPSAASQLKSNSISKQSSPASTPYSTSSGYSSISSLSRYSSNVGRKRSAAAAVSSIKDDYVPTSKRHRNKNKKSGMKRHYDMDEADTIEKRNLHNDMERQRRIGLKNLFEALKKQIPSIRDKERAPKVNILREAAKLCEQLSRDDKLLASKKQQLQQQLHRRQAQLKTSRM